MSEAAPFRGVLPLDGAGALVSLAGALAERGIAALRVERPGEASRTLAARTTDLPGEIGALLESGRPVRLEAASPPFTLELGPPLRGAWVTPDRELADALSSLSAAQERGR